jgi:hypothetical protein
MERERMGMVFFQPGTRLEQIEWPSNEVESDFSQRFSEGIEREKERMVCRKRRPFSMAADPE